MQTPVRRESNQEPLKCEADVLEPLWHHTYVREWKENILANAFWGELLLYVTAISVLFIDLFICLFIETLF